MLLGPHLRCAVLFPSGPSQAAHPCRACRVLQEAVEQLAHNSEDGMWIKLGGCHLADSKLKKVGAGHFLEKGPGIHSRHSERACACLQPSLRRRYFSRPQLASLRAELAS